MLSTQIKSMALRGLLALGLLAPGLLVPGLLAGPALAARTDINVGMVLEPPNLDPTAGAAAAIDEVVYANVFEGLTRYDADGAVIPDLARSWDISDDGRVYTFHLAQGVTFHDGAKFSADDVKFTLDRARGANSTNAQKGIFTDIAKVEVLDALTVRVTLGRPNGNFLFDMASGDAVIVSPKSADTNATHPIGTGPYAFKNWGKGDHVELVKYSNYWGKPVRLDKIDFKFISDPTAAFAAMMSGDLDVFPNFPAPETLDRFKDDPRFKVLTGTTEGETILAMNNARAPLSNKLVREAIAHAIDRKAIIEGAMFGYGTPIGTHFAPHNPAYVDLTALSDYDPAKARELLAEAGYMNGFDTTLKLPPPPYARRGGEIIAAQLRAVGIRAKILNVEWAQWLEDVFKGNNYDLTVVSHTEPMDIGIYARDDYYFGYHSAAFKKIMSDLDNTTDPEKRTRLLQQAQRRIAEDFVNAYLFQLAKTGVARVGIEGLWVNSPTQANDMTGVYWKD